MQIAGVSIMRILIMNWRDITNPSAGGAELVTHEIAKRWIQWGNQVGLLTSMYPSAKSDEIINGLAVTRAGGKYSVYLASAHRFLNNYSHSYDVIVDQINSIPFMTPLYCRVPIVPFVFQLTGEIYRQMLPKAVSPFAIALEPLLLRLYAKRPTIVLSNSTKRELVSIGFRPDRIFVCRPGVDHDGFGIGSKTKYPSILYMNRFARYKNPDHVVIAFKEVLNALPSSKLTMAGARTLDEIRSVKKLVEDLDLAESVEILPFVGGEAKVRLLQESWVHILPSTKEGWGISILEAAACGTPTVGYNVAGVCDAVKHKETGLLVESGNVESLAGGMITILQDASVRTSLSEGAARFAGDFSWDSTAKEAMVALHKALED
jgi:glycosyltransferase involved in cell wall biosynthesis